MIRIALVAEMATTLVIPQEPRAHSNQQHNHTALIDWTKIEIKTTDLGNNTYLLEGYNNTTVAVGTDGIIMVDSQFAPLSEKVKAAIKIIAPLPIKYLINTHFHGDHTGGNRTSPKTGLLSWRTTTSGSAWQPALRQA